MLCRSLGCSVTSSSSTSGPLSSLILNRSLSSFFSSGNVQDVAPDQASTSSHPSSSSSYSPALSALYNKQQAKMYATLHYKRRTNMLTPIDTNDLTAMLQHVSTAEAAALPVLKYLDQLNPQQTTSMLERLPRLLTLHRKGTNPDWLAKQKELTIFLVSSLANRFAAIMPHCKDEELARGLWALGKTWACSASSEHQAVMQSAVNVLLPRLPHISPKHLSTAAWALAAAGHLSNSTPTPITASKRTDTSAGAAERPPFVDLLARHVAGGKWQVTAVKREEGGAMQGGLDHRSICRLARAFAWSGRPAKEAMLVLSGSAAQQMDELVKAHDPATGALQPRRRYLYRTIKGWSVYEGTPRPPRPRSKYLHDDSPLVVTTSFDVSTAASLVHSCARLGHSDPRLMSAVTRMVTAALPAPLSLPALPAGTELPEPAPAGLLRSIPATLSGTAAGSSNTAINALPTDMITRVSGKVRAQNLSKKDTLRLIRGFYRLRRKAPELAAALLRSSHFRAFTPGELTATAHMCVALGVRDPALYTRLVRAVYPVVDSLQPWQAAQLASVCARTSYWPDLDPDLMDALAPKLQQLDPAQYSLAHKALKRSVEGREGLLPASVSAHLAGPKQPSKDQAA